MKVYPEIGYQIRQPRHNGGDTDIQQLVTDPPVTMIYLQSIQSTSTNTEVASYGDTYV